MRLRGVLGVGQSTRAGTRTTGSKQEKLGNSGRRREEQAAGFYEKTSAECENAPAREGWRDSEQERKKRRKKERRTKMDHLEKGG